MTPLNVTCYKAVNRFKLITYPLVVHHLTEHNGKKESREIRCLHFH